MKYKNQILISLLFLSFYTLCVNSSPEKQSNDDEPIIEEPTTFRNPVF